MNPSRRPQATWRGSAPSSARRGFSLVELIVVVAMLMLLISILFPAMQSARRAARTAACLSNVRGLQQAHLAYATDHRGLFADVGLPHGGLGVPEESFVTTLASWLDDPKVLHSPLDRSIHWPSSQGGAGTPVPGSGGALRRTSYGLNNYLSRNYSPAAAIDPGSAADRLTRVPAPASTVMVLFMAEEGEYAGSDHPHVEEWWVGNAAPDLPPVQAASQVATAAAGGKRATWDAQSNWGFVDGHVATTAFNDVYLTNQINRFDPEVAGTFTARTGGGGK